MVQLSPPQRDALLFFKPMVFFLINGMNICAGLLVLVKLCKSVTFICFVWFVAVTVYCDIDLQEVLTPPAMLHDP